MRLEEIFKNLIENNSRDFYRNLQNSKDKRCRRILMRLHKGFNLYESISPEFDYLGRIFLEQKTPKVFEILGFYLEIKSNFQKAIFSSMLYPFFLIIMSFFLLMLLNSIANLSLFYFLILIFLISISTLIFFLKIFYKFYEIVRMQVVYNFLLNNITFNVFKSLSIILKIPLPIEFSRTEDLIFHLIKKNSFNNLKQDLEKEQKNFPQFCKKSIIANISSIITIIILFSTAIFIFGFSKIISTL